MYMIYIYIYICVYLFTLIPNNAPLKLYTRCAANTQVELWSKAPLLKSPTKVALFPGCLHTAGVMAMTADTLVGFNNVLVILSGNIRDICSNYSYHRIP